MCKNIRHFLSDVLYLISSVVLLTGGIQVKHDTP